MEGCKSHSSRCIFQRWVCGLQASTVKEQTTVKLPVHKCSVGCIRSLNHLRRQIVQRATHRLAPARRRMHRPPKVCNLQVPIQPQQQVLRLDVPMDDMLRVAVAERLSHGPNVPAAMSGNLYKAAKTSVRQSV